MYIMQPGEEFGETMVGSPMTLCMRHGELQNKLAGVQISEEASLQTKHLRRLPTTTNYFALINSADWN